MQPSNPGDHDFSLKLPIHSPFSSLSLDLLELDVAGRGSSSCMILGKANGVRELAVIVVKVVYVMNDPSHFPSLLYA